MKRWIAITLAAGAATLIASAADGAGTMQKSGMGMGMQNQEMQNRKMMKQQGMMGGMMGADAQKRMMSDPEVQKMMSEHQQKMQEEQSRFREAMQKKMMSDPQNIQMMLQNMLQNQEAFKKTLNDNPELKEQLKKAL
jgi:hypothetical protein